MRVLRLVAGLTLLAIFGISGYWSARIAWAENAQDADRHLRIADSLLRKSLDPRPELSAAAALRPDDYRIWIRLAAECEARGDPASAERFLLRAANVYRFEPRWRLLNFYFRQRNSKEFWRWARESLSIAYDDPTPLFRLCREMESPGLATEAILPTRASVLRPYLRYLTAERDLARAENVAARLLPVAETPDLPDLLIYLDGALAAQRTGTALRIWNEMARRALIPYPPLDPEHGAVITNGTFAHRPYGNAFDWRVPAVDGTTAVRLGKGSGLRITLSGRQPEYCELLEQWIPGGDRRIRIQYRAQAAGLRWRLIDIASGKEIAGMPSTGASAELRLPARLVRLVLSYQRAPGTTRAEGVIQVSRVVEL